MNKDSEVHKEVSVHKEMSVPKEVRIETGIPYLNQLIGGGYLEKSVIAVSGGAGSGKTTFAMQFLMEGIKQDENVMYISFNLKKKEVFRQFTHFNFGLDVETIKNRMVIIEYPPSEIQELLKKDSAVREMIKSTNISRLVIDPITSFVYLQPDENQRRQDLYALVDNLKYWGVTSLLIDNDSKFSLHEIPRTMTGVEGFTDGFIHLSYILNITKMQRMRGMVILKMRGAPDDIDIHKVEITNKGMKLFK